MSRILIIEDDKEISEIERDYLELDGFEADIANNGITGLEKALSGGYDLVLLDLMLPGMDGFSICKRLREKLDIPILMVTARTQDVDKIRGLGFGADDYIEKPFSPSVLVARVKTNLAQYKRLKPEEKPKAVLTVGDLTFAFRVRARQAAHADEQGIRAAAVPRQAPESGVWPRGSV